jgi:hypothetical protein
LVGLKVPPLTPSSFPMLGPHPEAFVRSLGFLADCMTA